MATATSGAPNTPSRPQSRTEQLERPQAGPLPRKRGEIGFVEGEDDRRPYRSSSPDIVLPPRHPADRDVEQGPAANGLPASTNVHISPPEAPLNVISTDSGNASSIDSASTLKRKGHHLLRLFKCKHESRLSRKFYGITLSTLLIFILQVILFLGSIVAWVFAAQIVQKIQKPNGDQMLSSAVLMHVVVGLAVLAQLFLLERRLFRVRAERYSHIHPGEMLPRHHRPSTSSGIIALSPWNRPPLPTYAAALAQSGRGTGDVEDHLIAQEPPPIYGNTRGSTFLLSGPLGVNVQRPPSVHSVSSMPERPRSYVSRDGDWEIIQNAERARCLENTLGRLQRSVSQSSRR
ncbi:hypothetical protein Agabi119p4_7314 [Agaricus bisporus var. burnettii]|uniref:Uncharacterized protein n=1 Tax=Agaricus bisporus var. burnettii TaxID=192524 RepID=A0A8H7C700_AGABI|nr:hypothetical protein Agabi119p4_7314 [Agaricus bisporus var. burnettii]